MKKALYGTTALVAAGLVAGQASAASGLKLGISGFYRNAVGVEFSDSNGLTTGGGAPFLFPPAGTQVGAGDWGRNNVAFRQEVRVNFSGSTTLDNGLTFDVLIGLNAGGANSRSSNAPARINRAYMDVSGKFGQVRFGDANSAYQSMCVGDPGNVTANFGMNSPNESFSNAGRFAPGIPGGTFSGATVFMPTAVSGAGTCYGLETRSTKIMYFSPTFGGFNFAVSYAPTHIRGAGGSGGNGGTNAITGFHNFLSVGADFTHDFGGVTLTAGGAGEWALTGHTASSDNAGTIPNKPSIYQGGVQVSFGPWAVGASGQYVVNYPNAGYGSIFGFANTTDDAYMITVGGSWNMDAVSVGLQGLFNHYGVSGGGMAGSNVEYWGVSLNGAYALGPGISLEGQIAWTEADNNFGGPPGSFANAAANAAKVDAFEFDLGTAINF